MDAKKRQVARPGSAISLFTSFDKNKDGKLSKAEVPPQVWRRLGAADSDKNGVVSRGEFEKASASAGSPFGRGGRGGPSFGGFSADRFLGQFDRDKNGKVSKDEVPGPVWTRLSMADVDKDGFVTKEEFAKTMSSGQPSSGRRERVGMPLGKLADSFFKDLDTNGDSKLTETEVPAQIWGRIQVADTDKDGAVTNVEFKSRAGSSRGTNAKKKNE